MGVRKDDFSAALGMLHTAITSSGTDLRDALSKGVEKLEASGRAAQEETSRNVVSELSRMRDNLREARNGLSAGERALNDEVRNAVAELRAEFRGVREAVEDLAVPDVPATAAPAEVTVPYGRTENGTSSSAAETLVRTEPRTAPAAGAADDAALRHEPVLPAIPAQRGGGDDELSADVLQQALRNVVAQELAPLTALLAQRNADGQDQDDDVPSGPDVSEQLLGAVGELRTFLETARREVGAELAALRDGSAELRAGLEQLHVRAVVEETAAAVVDKEHSELLKRAARVSSVDLLCHRDIWEFVTAQAGRHPHFRVPPQVADEGAERIRAAVSGRSLIALLISLHAVEHAARDGDGDRELAATLYERIETSLAALAGQGEPVTITLDDRTPPVTSPHVPSAAAGDAPDQPTSEQAHRSPPQPPVADGEDQPPTAPA
ncbi:hypothetical protein [Streptomyces sp. NBC_00525]|uniref:hypothetical protein n=1 Tax=Streptomyces sp. NBC_00525 TaxID=2903660 RepID=UPI002E81DC72|nr:hypothetical protein [Streptomyces sp. NBC_00525]WUC98113.1 hypothetical protein OG710_31085 [Streptomyces sp. NBC_00525]